MGETVRHPVIVDTDALIAVANTQLWSEIISTLNLTTTNVCIQELKRHVQENSEFAQLRSRQRKLHEGSKAALEPFEDDSNTAFTVTTSVPRPHGADAGEASVRQEISQHSEAYRYAILMDREGRKSINPTFEEADTAGRALAPPFLLYLLLHRETISREEFCQACGELLQTEGWTGYQAIQAAWEAIPIDCDDFLPAEFLP